MNKRWELVVEDSDSPEMKLYLKNAGLKSCHIFKYIN